MDPLLTTFLQFLGVWLALMAAITVLGPRLAQWLRPPAPRPALVPIRQRIRPDRARS